MKKVVTALLLTSFVLVGLLVDPPVGEDSVKLSYDPPVGEDSIVLDGSVAYDPPVGEDSVTNTL